MKYKTLFRLALKVLGVMFLFQGLMEVPGAVVQVFQFTSMGNMGGAFGGSSFMEYGWAMVSMAHTIFSVTAGIYLFWGGKWIVDKAIPSNRPYCHECGYELSKTSGNACPECGVEFRRVSEAER